MVSRRVFWMVVMMENERVVLLACWWGVLMVSLLVLWKEGGLA